MFMPSVTRNSMNKTKKQILNFKFQKLFWILFFGFWFLPVNLASANFTDVDVTHPYFHSITELQDTGVVEGHEVEGRRKFFPLSEINRAEALKLILLSTQTPQVDESQSCSENKST